MVYNVFTAILFFCFFFSNLFSCLSVSHRFPCDPYISRSGFLYTYAFRRQEEITKTEFLSSLSDDGLKEAEILRDKILSTGDSLLISGLVSGEIVSMVLFDFIMQDPEKAAEYREDLLFDCATLIYEGGFLVVDVIDDEKTKICGVAGLEPGKWKSISKEELEQIVCSDEDGNPVPLDDGEEFVDFADMVKE